MSKQKKNMAENFILSLRHIINVSSLRARRVTCAYQKVSHPPTPTLWVGASFPKHKMGTLVWVCECVRFKMKHNLTTRRHFFCFFNFFPFHFLPRSTSGNENFSSSTGEHSLFSSSFLSTVRGASNCLWVLVCVVKKCRFSLHVRVYLSGCLSFQYTCSICAKEKLHERFRRHVTCAQRGNPYHAEVCQKLIVLWDAPNRARRRGRKCIKMLLDFGKIESQWAWKRVRLKKFDTAFEIVIEIR